MANQSETVKARQTARRLEVLERAGGRCIYCDSDSSLALVEVGGPYPGRMTMSPSHIAITDNPAEFEALLKAILPFRDLVCRACANSRYRVNRQAALEEEIRQLSDAVPA